MSGQIKEDEMITVKLTVNDYKKILNLIEKDEKHREYCKQKQRQKREELRIKEGKEKKNNNYDRGSTPKLIIVGN